MVWMMVPVVAACAALMVWFAIPGRGTQGHQLIMSSMMVAASLVAVLVILRVHRYAAIILMIFSLLYLGAAAYGWLARRRTKSQPAAE